MQVSRPDSEIQVPPRLGFGCAGLMRIPTRSKRQRLLDSVLDAGITHFDVARSYGLGVAERELRQLVRAKRDQITIATKFGIKSSPPARTARLQGPARALLARSTRMRSLVRSQAHVLHQPRSYTPAAAQASLELSLRELDTDYVDLLLIHEPHHPDEVPLSDLQGYLAELRRAGKIRAWGVSGDAEPLSIFANSTPPDMLLQVRDSILDRYPAQLQVRTVPSNTFGILSGAVPRIVSHVSASRTVSRFWADAVGADCADPETVAALLIKDALQANRAGFVLFGTTKPERVASAARSAHSGDDGQLAAFQNLVASQLGLESQVDDRS